GEAGPAAAEECAEQVREPGTAEALVGIAAGRAAEEVAQIERRLRARVTAERSSPKQGTHLVVLAALALIREDVVGLGNRLESLLGIPVAGIAVGVQLPGQLPVGPLDLLGGGRLGNL